MSDRIPNVVSEVSPSEAFAILKSSADAVLVDVRTRAEWVFVGMADLSETPNAPLFLEWQAFPEMQVNTNFAADLFTGLHGKTPSGFYFLCRSGVRSLAAAHAVAAECDVRGMSADCVNIIGGFEGDPDMSGHRGRVNGWKAEDLAWHQR
jgi:rhodanese-related sulfurtransferase